MRLEKRMKLSDQSKDIETRNEWLSEWNALALNERDTCQGEPYQSI